MSWHGLSWTSFRHRKDGKWSKFFWEKINFDFPLYNVLKIHWNFAIIYSRFEISWYIEIFTDHNLRPCKCRSRSWCTILTVAPIDRKYPTSYLMAIVIFSLSLTVYEISTYQEKCQNFYLENESQGQGVEKRDLCHSTINVGVHIGDFFRILAT